MTEPQPDESEETVIAEIDKMIKASCPIDTQSHSAHDAKIIELLEFRDATHLTPKRLADRVIHLEHENERLTAKAKSLQEQIDLLQKSKDRALLDAKNAADRLRDHIERFHGKKDKA